MSKQNTKIIIGVIVGLCLIVALFFLPKGEIKVDSGYREVMGTFARIVAVAPDSSTANKSIKAGFTELGNVDDLMSDYKDDSEITKINRNAHKAAVNVSEPTFEVLQKALEFSELSDGAFDITVGAMVDLWRSAAQANSVPTEDELAAARSKVGYEKLALDATAMSVRFAVDGMRLDLGGIAKGYAIDKAVEAMQECGATGGMVDVGGDIRCFGTPPRDRKTWLIGLQDPDKPEDWIGTSKPSLVLKLTDAAIATSGGYRRFVLVEGKKYSHIINRKTGHGSNRLASVTIIASNAIESDALATAVSVMGAEKGLALIEKLPETEAILIPSQPEHRLIKTSGAEKYINPN